MRHTFGWDLPPGVTNRMIDEAAGAFDEDEPDHEEEEAFNRWADQQFLEMEGGLSRERVNAMSDIERAVWVALVEFLCNQRDAGIYADEQSLDYFNRYIAGDR